MVSLQASFCAVLLPLDVLDEIWDATETVSEGFLTYSTYFTIGMALGVSLLLGSVDHILS